MRIVGAATAVPLESYLRGNCMKTILPSLMLWAAAAVAAYAQVPVVTSGGVSNAANGIAPVTPGSLVSIYGSNLAAGLAQADTIPLATTMSNISVTFNGVPAPLLFVSGGQINAQLPWNVLSSRSEEHTSELQSLR